MAVLLYPLDKPEPKRMCILIQINISLRQRSEPRQYRQYEITKYTFQNLFIEHGHPTISTRQNRN